MSEHTMNFMPSEGFRARSKAVVENPFLRQSFRGAMDFLINKRITQFPNANELETLRTLRRQPDAIELVVEVHETAALEIKLMRELAMMRMLCDTATKSCRP